MAISAQTYDILVGSEVYGSDGDKVGRVAEVYPGYITVEKGFFFPTDYFIPIEAIQSVQGENVYLTVTKDAALNRGWDRVPTTQELTGISNDETISETPLFAESGTSVANRVDQDEIHIPLAEEDLTATVRPTEAGAVRIEKRVVSEDRVLDVPVTDEQIRVERRVVDRPLDAADVGAFEQVVVEVPLHEETVDVQKRARVAEEVVVSKEAVQHTERVTGTVRHEEIVFDEDARIDEVNP